MRNGTKDKNNIKVIVFNDIENMQKTLMKCLMCYKNQCFYKCQEKQNVIVIFTYIY